MPIMGFGFDKIHIEKKADPKKGQEINNKVQITSLQESKLMLGQEEKTSLMIFFEYVVDYKEAGNLTLLGHIFYLDIAEKIQELTKEWSSKKTVPENFAIMIYNYIFSKTNLKALQLQEEVGLPHHLHLQTPRLRPVKEQLEEKSKKSN